MVYLARRPRRTEVGKHTVSTVALGDIWPHTWETLVTGPSCWDQYTERYDSAKAAIKGHQRICQLVKNARQAQPKRIFIQE